MRHKSIFAAVFALACCAAGGASAQFYFGEGPRYATPYYAPGPHYAPHWRRPDRRRMVYGNVCVTPYLTCGLRRLTPLNAPCHCRTSVGDVFHGRVGAQ
ncbi:MAG: hypothetical protein KGQ28_08045 [Hyphomicrobiales bacterium]|nr:hypothetical protein [Hyphomicrobiales bacterium]